MSYDRSIDRNRRSAREWAGQGEKHVCAVHGCREMIPRRLLMCAAHWRMVPSHLQRAVYDAFRNKGAGEYISARQAAIDSVEKGQL